VVGWLCCWKVKNSGRGDGLVVLGSKLVDKISW